VGDGEQDREHAGSLIGTGARPVVTPVARDFFSARIGCITYQPLYGISLGALCIRRRS
jgi:hypothetical protein